MRKTGSILGVVFVALLAPVSAGAAPLSAGEILGNTGSSFDLVWDGWTGRLFLGPQGNSSSSRLESGGRTHRVRYTILREAQDLIAGRRGPGFQGTNTSSKYRVVLWIDLSNTPKNLRDDQVFDGYFFTQNRSQNLQLAGITWWGNMPFGFYGKSLYIVP